MATSQDEFLRELLKDFKIEAAEHLHAIVKGLLLLEKKPAIPEFHSLVEEIFREFHSLKGASRAVSFGELEGLCQGAEDVFHRIKDGKLSVSPVLFEILFKVTDVIHVLLTEFEHGRKTPSGMNIPHILKSLELLLKPAVPDPGDAPNPEPPPVTGSPAAKLVQPEHHPRVVESPAYEKAGQKNSLRISVTKLESLLNQTEELVTAKATLQFLIAKLHGLNGPEFQLLRREFERFGHSFSRICDDLMFQVKDTLLFPFSSITDAFPKTVRDLGKSFQKEIQVEIIGAETEIDRRILEQMKDPLIHIIRNCVDHGIERPAERLKAGKPPTGTIQIHIAHGDGRLIELVITDDGAGIDQERLKELAVKKGIIQKESLPSMTVQETLALIFRSGFSTSQMISDLSGRGLGMAIVAEKVNNLGGWIHVESELGKGSRFVVKLPLTLSVFRGILIEVAGQEVIISSNAVVKATRIVTEDISYAESRPFLHFQSQSIPLVKLADMLGLKDKSRPYSPNQVFHVIILGLGGAKIGCMVDSILNEQEGIVKDLGAPVVHIRNIAGATILGDGNVVPILHVPDLFQSFAKTAHNSLAIKPDDTSEKEDESRQPAILVADDSITTRNLIRNILEMAGFQVKTAVDGLQALQHLQDSEFDMVVSDVEMPGMNGFELTAKIRSDRRFAHLPVILVTALSNESDKIRGLDAGASAYIVKSSFKDDNLIDTIRRLI